MDHSKKAVNIFDKWAAVYQQKYMDVAMYASGLDLFCDLIGCENAPILELACGPGNITKYLLDKQPNFKVLGTDLAPNMIHLAKLNNPNATFKLLDCRSIGQLKESYHGIVGGFCLPYLSREETTTLIWDAAAILNQNGVLYLSTIEDDYRKSGLQHSSSGDAMYMYFHEANYLIEALCLVNFEIMLEDRVRYKDTNGKQITDLILVAKKGKS